MMSLLFLKPVLQAFYLHLAALIEKTPQQYAFKPDF